MSRKDLRRAGMRLRIVGGVLVLSFALLAARATVLTVIDERGARRGLAQTGTVLTLAAGRGSVYDRNERALALTIQAPSAYAVPHEIVDLETTSRTLARALDQDAAALRRRLDQDRAFVFLDRWLSADEAARIEALALPGIGIVAEPRRTYPAGRLAGRFLGFANIDGDGVRGIEQAENAWLRGQSQKVALERDARGRLLAHGGVDLNATAGGDVVLSIDATLQAAAETALAEVVDATAARGGIVVVMDPNNGDLLAVAEAPDLDPAGFRDLAYSETRSRAFLDAFEPGSTLKPVVVAAALEAGVLRAKEMIDTGDGRLRVPGKLLRDRKPFGALTPAGILQVSSNVGVALIAKRLDRERHHGALAALGFGRTTGSGFPNESAGLLRRAQDWRPLDQATIAFGQGINVTPVQLAAAGAAIANGGTLRRPRLVVARRERGGDWAGVPVPPGRPALRRDVADDLREMMVSVTDEDGTGRRAQLVDISVAGKTGTAQKFDTVAGTYSQDDYASWFLGMAPAEDPSVVVVTMIDEPRGESNGGGATAAPLFARVAAEALGRKHVTTQARFGLPEEALWANRPPRDAEPEATALPAVAAAPPAPTAEVTVAAADSTDAGAEPAQAESAAIARAVPRTVAAGLLEPEASAPDPEPVDETVTEITPPADEVATVQRPVPDVSSIGNRVLLPDLRGLTLEQIEELADRFPFALELEGEGYVTRQDPAPGSVVGADAALRLTFARRDR